MSDAPQTPPEKEGVPSAGGQAGNQPAPAEETPLSAAKRDHLPAIPGYEVLGRLGAGGMGIVYKARHLALNRLVAIKVLNRIQQATEREILRLQMEGETVANLQHPNIVPLYQMGEFAGLPFLTFEYIDGGTLADRIGGRPQPPREAAELVEVLARAVQLAHQQGVLHRDLKPANVLLSKDGVPKIADFGLARRLDNHEFSTELIAGTANYMSPEQAWGDTKTNPLTPATDVYSLGAILYELLTGRPPFASDSREETIKDVWSKTPAEPRILAPDVPPDLQTICLKCLEKEPGRRYSSALELADDLHRWLGNEPIVARPTTRFERAVLWCRRDPVFAGVLAALVVAILAGAIGSSWLAVIYREQRIEAERAAFNEKKAAFEAKYSAIAADKAAAEAKANAALANKAAEEARNNEALAKYNEALAKSARADVQHREADRNRAIRLLEASNEKLASTNDQVERRLYESLILATARDIESKDLKELTDHLSRCPPRSRDIEWNIRNRQMQGGLLRRPVTRQQLVAMAISPDGKWVATGGRDNKDNKGEPIRVWSIDDWQLRASLNGQGHRFVFSPDSQWLAVDDRSTGVEIWNWRENRLLRKFSRAAASAKTDPIGDAIFSPDGRHLAIGRAGTVQIYPLKEGDVKEAQVERTLTTGPATSLHYCPDNRRLVVLARLEDLPLSGQSVLQVWDATNGALIRSARLGEACKLMCVSPDGRECAVTRNYSLEMRLYDLNSGDLNSGQFRKFEAEAEPKVIRFSRDGHTLLIADKDGKIELIDTENLKLKSSLVSLFFPGIVDLDSLPDGRIVSANEYEGALQVWPGDGQSRLPHWYAGGLPYALSHDGRELAVGQPDHTVRRFDLNDNRELPRLPAQELTEAAGAGKGAPNNWGSPVCVIRRLRASCSSPTRISPFEPGNSPTRASLRRSA